METTQQDFKNARTLVVGGDWIDAPTEWIPAVRIVRYWNGWAVPAVTRAAIEQLASQLDGINQVAHFGSDNLNGVETESEDTLVYHSTNDDEPIVIEPSDDGTYVVDLGWCFDAYWRGTCPLRRDRAVSRAYG